MQRKTIEAYSVRTIDWFDDKVVDWNSAGTQYLESGEKEQLHKYHYGFVCDGSITSENGVYVLIFQKLGTKGLLLKNGELLREINRSYYQSSVYEFPAAFFTLKNKTYLVHCPAEYCRLDFEDVETGEIITKQSERDPQDFFHSRLEVSKDNKYLLSKGWFWHPFDSIELFDIEQCISDPKLLDRGKSIPDVTSEICSASFIDNNRILVCASNEEPMDDENEEPIPPGHIAIWNIESDEVSKAVKINGEFGNVFAINDKRCWDLYKYPKIIDLINGEIIDKLEELSSGEQGSSIIHHLKDLPKIAFNQETKQIAIATDNKIEILTE
jgi:hypothetical protein